MIMAGGIFLAWVCKGTWQRISCCVLGNGDPRRMLTVCALTLRHLRTT